jgi:hypothetical protein
MKKSILAVGGILILLNTIISMIFQDYATHKMIFGDMSIALSTSLLYLIYKVQTSDGFKIGNTLLFGLSGLIRFICAVSSSSELKNNYALLIFIIVLCIEGLLIFVSHAMRNK